MDKQKEIAQTMGVVERSENKVVTKFGTTMAVMTKESITVTVQSK